MSAAPSPARVEPNTMVEPSQEKVARVSAAGLLMPLSRWVRFDHGALVESRDAVHRSGPPSVPGRVESKTISRPSLLTLGLASSKAVFSSNTGIAGARSILA